MSDNHVPIECAIVAGATGEKIGSQIINANSLTTGTWIVRGEQYIVDRIDIVDNEATLYIKRGTVEIKNTSRKEPQNNEEIL